MHQVVPHFILDRYAAGQTRGDFSAVALFADISGFSAMTDSLMTRGQHGAEVLAGVMQQAFTPLIESVYQQSGFIATRAGDAFTALFPLHADSTAQRALTAAMNIQNKAAAQSSLATPYGEVAISVKVGLALGEISWGIVPSEDGRRAAYYFRGSAVDGCAAAEHHALAGDVILDGHLYEQVREIVVGEHLNGYFRLATVESALPDPLRVNLPEPELDLVAPFLPRQVVTQPFTAEFRQVTHLFIKLPTVRTEAQLGIFMQSLFKLLDRYGGLLNRLDFGDKGSNLLLFWGVPAAHENDVDRCLNFVLDLQAQTSIPISAGVTHQLAYAGFVGSVLNQEYTCFGRGVNLAARFMSASPRGEIWLDEGAARRAEQGFEVDPLGEQSFKGFSQAQNVFALIERKRERLAFFAGKMVGREAELSRLNQFVQPIFSGRFAGLLLVCGDAGVGKSRLVHEFQNLPIFSDNQVLWALCQADEIVRQSLNPFRYWLNQYFGQSIEQSDARNKRNFNRKLDALIEATRDGEQAAELDRTRSFLGALIDLRWPDSLYEQFDAQARYENTFIALTGLLKAESCRQPLIILIEDAHWLDDDTKSYLAHLARALAAGERQSYSIAILATARYEGTGLPLDDVLASEEIRLGELGREELSRLVEGILAGPPSALLVDLLAQAAEGNPFFAEQILHYLRAEQLLEQGDRGWTVRGTNTDRSPLPADVRTVLVVRLDRLPAEVRDAVQTAAVLGREFDLRLLAGMLQDDRFLPQKIAQAEQAAIWTALNEQQYVFRHALLRETAYSMQLRARRQQLHKLAAEALEKLYAGQLAYHYAELAYHTEQAGIVEPARRYLRLAGDAARDEYQNSLAVGYYARALKLTPARDLEARYALHSAREALFDLQGKRDEQLRELDVMGSLAIELEDTARQVEVEVKRVVYLNDIGEHQVAAVKAEEAISLARDMSAGEIVIDAHMAACKASHMLAEYETAIQHGETAIAKARQAGDRVSEGRTLNMLGMIAVDRQNPSAAKAFFEDSLKIFGEVGELRSQPMPLNNLGILSGIQGDHAAAQDYYQQSLTIAREVGDRAGQGLVLGNLGWASGMLGDFVKARDYAGQAVRISREVGSPMNELYGLLHLNLYARALGEFENSLENAQRALELARQTRDPNAEAWSLTYLGHSLLHLDRAAEAGPVYQRALDIRRELDQPVLQTEPAAGLARVALELSDLAAARAQVASILAYLDRGGTLDGTDEPLRVYLNCYLVLHAAGDERAAPVLGTARKLLLERVQHIQDEAARAAFLENVPDHREILTAWERHQAKGLQT